MAIMHNPAHPGEVLREFIPGSMTPSPPTIRRSGTRFCDARPGYRSGLDFPPGMPWSEAKAGCDLFV
jgi:hypothetical protein